MNTILENEMKYNLSQADVEEFKQVSKMYPVRTTPYYQSLIKHRGDAIWKQSMPSFHELEDKGFLDPLEEERYSPVKSIVHRYPDRVLFYATSECAMFCRFCTRKRKVGKTETITKNDWDTAFEYIRQHPEIKDVLVSGGDPLTLSNKQLEYIISNIRSIKHVKIIRIGTRIPVVNPQRVTVELCNMLKKYHPLYINTHFNHPSEITEQSAKACAKLADVGIPLGNQSVLLKGVNDNIEIMKELVQELLTIRVKPYYIYMMDLVKGTNHFRTSIQTGLDIIEGLRGHTTGMAVPQLIIDAPNGGGKIPIMPETIISSNNEEITLRNFENKQYNYPLK